VLLFIGAKMLLEKFIPHIPVWVSLLVIVVCISGSIFYSIYHQRKGVPTDVEE
jgi:tellurite resistance protein TerC